MLQEEEPEKEEEEEDTGETDEEAEQQMAESCQNPFFPCTSSNPTHIALDIVYKGERLPICEDCWTKIADSDIEWSKQPY